MWPWKKKKRKGKAVITDEEIFYCDDLYDHYNLQISKGLPVVMVKSAIGGIPLYIKIADGYLLSIGRNDHNQTTEYYWEEI